jgi:hypothetical protein
LAMPINTSQSTFMCIDFIHIFLMYISRSGMPNGMIFWLDVHCVDDLFLVYVSPSAMRTGICMSTLMCIGWTITYWVYTLALMCIALIMIVLVQPITFGVHFFFLKSQSIMAFSRSLLPRSVEKRPTRYRLEIENE